MDTIEKIKKIAIREFSSKGYSGTSMSSIAQEVGIKKASIYFHFQSKLELFEACMDDTKDQSIETIKNFIEQRQNALKERANGQGSDSLETIHDTLMYYGTIDNQDTEEMFRIRFCYMAPEEVEDRVIHSSNSFLEKFRDVVKPLFEGFGEDALDAYLCIFDGLMIELLFGDKNTYAKRLDATWGIFVRGIKR